MNRRILWFGILFWVLFHIGVLVAAAENSVVEGPVSGASAVTGGSPASGTLPSGFYTPAGMEKYTSPAYCAIQDSLGFVWIGTESGLLKYDAHHIYSYQYSSTDSRSICNNHVSSLLYCPDLGQMIVGTDTGVSVYNFDTDDFFTLSACGYRQVKTLLRDADSIYVGSADGLQRIVLEGGRLSLDTQADTSFYIEGYIACAAKIGSNLYFGSHDGFYQYDGLDIKYLQLSTERKLVLAFAYAEDDDLWLGTEQGLILYKPRRGAAAEVRLGNIPVKNFFRHPDGSLWVCTDDGLFINSPGTDIFSQYRHEAQNSNSLPDNVVWSVSGGAQGHIFICTDHGLAMPRISIHSRFQPLSSFTGSREGLNVEVMASDPHGNLWLGGMNGLVMKYPDGRRGRWYKADNDLSHNKIRDLYDDTSGLIVLSDGGFDRIDYGSGRVIHYNIADPEGKEIYTWMYSLTEDAQGRLWLGTYNGMVMIEDKAALLSSPSKTYRADRLYEISSGDGISGNAVIDVAATEDFIAAVSFGSVYCIDSETLEQSYVSLPEDLYATSLEADGDMVWVGTSKGLYRLSAGGRIEAVPGFGLQVRDIVLTDGSVALISGQSIFIYDIDRGSWSHYPFGDMSLFCGIDGGEGLIYAGSADGYFEVDGRNIGGDGVASVRIAATSLHLDNSLVRPGHEYDGKVILNQELAATDEVVLRHSQNSFTIEYSTFDFSGQSETFVYRLRGFEDRWQETSDYRAVFLNVPGGKYVFEVAVLAADGTQIRAGYSLPVRVRTVWYATLWAYLLYGLIFIGLCVAFYSHLRMRHQLQIEHIERDRALKMIDLKTEFLSNLSHEFKSPLSIILGFVGRLVTSESNSMKTRELQTIQKNAEKIHLLLGQMVEFNENRSLSLFIPTATDLPALVREVYQRYEAAYREKGIASRFMADEMGYVFMVDRVKMESAVENLLSNALKFTHRGGSVLVSVSAKDEGGDMVYADIRVEDTGCGIAAEDLPKVFNRYYRSAASQAENPSGSGIGLALVKQVAELHKGSVSVTSEPGRGSAFTIRLSTMKADSFILKAAQGGEAFSLHSLSNVWQHDRKPIILLVEDNADIRDFITASLGNDYVFVTAADGREGLSRLAGAKIDLVITDIAMPGMDGLTMSRQIRNSMSTAFLPIIVLTGKNDAQTEMQSFEYADVFIAKPFSLDYLNGHIIQLLIRHEQHLAKIRQQKMLEQSVEEEQSPDEKILQEVVEIVNRHLEDPQFSASVLCAESRYSSKQIYRKVKQLTGMSIVEFIRDTRLRKAALYLEQGKLTVTEVMYKVGFTTASYFSKCFKEKFGCVPSDYQSKIA